MLIFFCWIYFLFITTLAVNAGSDKQSYHLDDGPENDIADLIKYKGYIPNENSLPQSSVLRSNDDDATYLLSKLSDSSLIKLLNKQPLKQEYDLNDIANTAMDSNNLADTLQSNKETKTNTRFDIMSNKDNSAYFRLEDKEVDPYSFKTSSNADYVASQKLNNLLYSRPIHETDNMDETQKELLFNVLIEQLKSLCCKNNKLRNYSLKHTNVNKKANLEKQNRGSQNYQYMFLVINDEIKNNDNSDLISVDPNSLDKNSSVLLLGPINIPLTDKQLKFVMNRISNELSKDDYLPLLKQLSEGTLSNKNMNIMKSFVTGPETRRYIKPHRCNHQSPAKRVYGGPKWLICTGYLNLNTPSLYD